MQHFKLNVQVSDSKQEKDNNTGKGNCALMVLWFILHFGELILAAILKLNAKSEGAPDIWSSSVWSVFVGRRRGQVAKLTTIGQANKCKRWESAAVHRRAAKHSGRVDME